MVDGALVVTATNNSDSICCRFCATGLHVLWCLAVVYAVSQKMSTWWAVVFAGKLTLSAWCCVWE